MAMIQIAVDEQGHVGFKSDLPVNDTIALLERIKIHLLTEPAQPQQAQPG